MNPERHVGRLVRVTWEDAVGSSEWHTEREAKDLELATIVSVGIMLTAHADRVVLCADRDNAGNVNGVGVIPRGWIRRIERLR